jgi:hypothetical protein
MALRDRLVERIQPLVGPGQSIRHVFLTQSGMSPYSPLGGLIGALLRKYWIVAVTDGEIVVMRASMWRPAAPKAATLRVPRTVLAPSGKLWAKITLGQDTHYVHRRFFKDVLAQDAELIGTPQSD